MIKWIKNDGTSGSGNSLDFDDNIDHTKEENLEDNHCEDSSKEVQVAIVDDTTSDVDQSNTQADIHYKTKHANEIAKVLGTSEELKEFDTVRYRLKFEQTQSKHDEQKHKRLLYKLQLSVQVLYTYHTAKLRNTLYSTASYQNLTTLLNMMI